MDKFGFWVSWLKIVSAVFALFGLVLACFNQTTIFQMAFSNQIDSVFWGREELVSEIILYQSWIYGLLGATCVMVGILIFCIVKHAFAKREAWAWNCLLFGLVAWFVIDTPLSVCFQVYFNVAFNSLLLVAVLLPLLLTRKEFTKR